MIVKKIDSLITLLDDESEIVFEAVSRAILSEGVEIIPLLQKSLLTINNEPARTRLQYIIKRIEFHQCRTGLLEWIEDGAEDLLYGAYLIAKLEYPDLDFYHLSEEIDSIGSNIIPQLEPLTDDREKIRTINDYLFTQIKLERNATDPLDFHNNFIPDVIHNHKGNPTSLTILYLILCERLGLPISIVKEQRTVLLCYDNSFYINPLDKGEIIESADLEKEHEPTNHLFLLKTLLQALHYSFEQTGDERQGDIIDLINLIQ